MTATRPHTAAAAVLTLTGLIAAVGAAAITVASFAVAAGLGVRPADALLLDDLRAVLPFVVAFVALDIATARGLATGRAWAIAAGSMLTLGAVAMGTLGLLILGLANDPASLTGATRAAEGDGLAIVATFTVLNLAALLALRMDDLPSSRLDSAAA